VTGLSATRPALDPDCSLDALRSRHAALCADARTLNIARGKPSAEQLDLMAPMLAWSAADDHRAADGTDCRNYGGNPAGLAEARALFADILGVPPDRIIVSGNSSLALMHDSLVFLLLYGGPGGSAPWARAERTAFLCPVPGYDRHFAICEALGIEMIPVALTDDGPDMDEVERLAASDPAIRGMWCMPRYSNPTGIVYADSVIERLARMETAAGDDFHLLWDDAYAVHDLTDAPTPIRDIVAASAAAGHSDRPFVFASTSKITAAGAGLATMAGSPGMVAWWLSHAAVRTIGPNKLNQLRHVRFLRDRAGVTALMTAHRRILAPKFAAVDRVFAEVLGGRDGIRWTHPRGGYFIDLEAGRGRARRVVELAAQAGIVLTPAGAAFPYGDDPEDSHIRIAPSFPTLEEVSEAARGIALCVRLAEAEEEGTPG